MQEWGEKMPNAVQRRSDSGRQDQALEEEAGEGPLFTVNWLTFSCGLWFRCRAEHHRTWAISQVKIVLFRKVQQIPTQCMI